MLNTRQVIFHVFTQKPIYFRSMRSTHIFSFDKPDAEHLSMFFSAMPDASKMNSTADVLCVLIGQSWTKIEEN